MVIKRDFRTLAPATQAELRRIAVAMVRAGKTRVEAAATVGVNRRFVGQWVKVAAQGGEAVLAGRRRAGFTHEVPEVEFYAYLGNCKSPLALRGAVVSKPRGVIAGRVQLPGRPHA